MRKFWNILKKVLLVLSVMSIAVGFVFLLTSAIEQQKAFVCSNVQVDIDYDSGNSYINSTEIAERINFLTGRKIVGKLLTAVDFRTIEQDLSRNPYVAAAQVYVDRRQVLHVKITQKDAILRVINNDGVSYYLSNRNDHMPLCNKFTPHVPVALGFVETHTSKQRDSIVQAGLYKVIQLARQDTLFNALVDQVYVQESGEMNLIPRIGNQEILIGVPDDELSLKLEKLKIFYKEGLSRVGWNKYKIIDLRFEEQVVAVKKDSLI